MFFIYFLLQYFDNNIHRNDQYQIIQLHGWKNLVKIVEHGNGDILY